MTTPTATPRDPAEPLVIYVDRGPIAVVTLNRPDRRNALSRGLVVALTDLLAVLAARPAVRVVVLNGAGPVFCAGMDLKEAAERPDDEALAIADSRAIADLLMRIRQIPQPTIAALNGDAHGGGAGLAAACDFVVVAEKAKISFPEGRRGLVPAIVLPDLVHRVGAHRARSLLLTGTPIDAQTALAYGFADIVAPSNKAGTTRDEHPNKEGAEALDAACELAHTLLAAAPRAVSAIKRLLDEASTRRDDLRPAAAISAAARVGDEALEGIRAFLEKRNPSWMPPT